MKNIALEDIREEVRTDTLNFDEIKKTTYWSLKQNIDEIVSIKGEVKEDDFTESMSDDIYNQITLIQGKTDMFNHLCDVMCQYKYIDILELMIDYVEDEITKEDMYNELEKRLGL
jgi:hypothetical protein